MVNESIGKYIVFNGFLEESEDSTSFQLFKEVENSHILTVEDGVLLFEEDHMERIKKLNPKVDPYKIINNIYDLIEKNNIEKSKIKVLIYEDNVLIYETWTIEKDNQDQGVGVSILDFDWANFHEEILENTFDSQVSSLLMENENFEVLVRDPQGQLTEGSRSNLYFIKDKKIVKSDIYHQFSYLTSQQIEEIIKDKDMDCIVDKVYDYQLLDIEAAFICGDSFGIAPIKSIESIEINSQDHKTVKILMEEYSKLVEAYKKSSK